MKLYSNISAKSTKMLLLLPLLQYIHLTTFFPGLPG